MNDYWMKFSKTKITTHVLLLGFSGLFSITLINILLPLASYSKFCKVAAVFISFIMASILFYFLYLRFVQPILPDIRTHWLRNGLISAVLAGLIFSLAPLHLPYHPVEHTIQISTESHSLGFIHIVRHIKTGPPQLVDREDLKLSGDWELVGNITVHLNDQPAAIQYQKIEFVRESVIYHFSFQRQEHTTMATINIDGEDYFVEIEPEEQNVRTSLFIFETPNKASTSSFWQLWITIFPAFSAITLLIVAFFGVSFLFSRQQALPERGLSFGLFGILFYLLWITLGYQNDLYNHWVFHLGMLLLALLFYGLVPVGLHQLLKRHPKSIRILIALTLLLGVCLRVYWILMVPSAQVSDFGRFHQWALQMADGQPDLLIDRYASFTRMLSLLYRVYPGETAVEALNVIFSIGTMLCLYLIGKINHREEAGLMAAYFFGTFPSQISMVSIVNTDIPSVFLLTASIYSLVCFIQRNRWHCLLLSAAAFGFAYVIRGALLIYFPVLVIPLLLNQQQKLKMNLLRTAALLSVFLVTVAGVTGLLSFIKVDGLVIDEGRNMIWPLVNGTNIEALGRNNPADQELIFSWSPEEATKNGLKVVLDRVFSDPLAYYKFLKVKYEFQFANATYGANLAFFDETHEYFNFKTGWKYPIGTVRESFAQLSQYAYLVVLLAAVLASLKVEQPHWLMRLPVLVILLCAFGAYAFFEVQPRYSRPIIPFVILMAGLLFANRSKELAPEAAD